VNVLADFPCLLASSALVFNAFVWCQLFSQVNSRRLDRKLNIFENIWRNPWFISILLIECGAQVLIVFVGGAAFSVTRLGGRDWAISIIAGFISLPIGVLIRLIPTKPIEDFAVKWNLTADPNALPTTAPDTMSKDYVEKAKGYEATAIGEVAERLGAFSSIRGGRLRATGLNFKTRARRMRDADVHPQTLMALVPALIGASIGSGWKPSNPTEANLKDPANGEPTLDSVELYQGETRHADLGLVVQNIDNTSSLFFRQQVAVPSRHQGRCVLRKTQGRATGVIILPLAQSCEGDPFVSLYVIDVQLAINIYSSLLSNGFGHSPAGSRTYR
jgi:Cation transporting ATPase, C-terminus